MVDPEAPVSETPVPDDASSSGAVSGPDDALVAMEDGAAAAPTAAPAVSPVAAPDPEAPIDAADAGSGGARLVVKRNGAETDEVFPIATPATIGRFDPAVGPIDVDLAPLPEGQYVSRKHARLTRENGVWTVTDLGSSNGTFVLRDGEFERAESAELGDGDEFALGNARFVLRLS